MGRATTNCPPGDGAGGKDQGMNIDSLRNILIEEGIEIEEITIVKNCVQCKGLRIVRPGQEASPIVYYSEEETMSQLAARIRMVAGLDYPPFDPCMLVDPDFVLTNAYMAIQKKCEDNLAKRTCLNLETYLRVRLSVTTSESAYFRITGQMIAQLGLSESDLWNSAEQHFLGSVKIQDIAEVIGIPEDADGSLYVLTAEEPACGAAALAIPEIFRGFCEDRGLQSCVILPSSTEELLIIPRNLDDLSERFLNPSELAGMVQMINAEQVDPVIQLDPVVYVYRIIDDQIVIAAEVTR